MGKDLLERIAKALVDDPDGVSINCIEGAKSTILELKVNDGDVGKIIGKQGRIAVAIRIILNAALAKQKRRVILEILD